MSDATLDLDAMLGVMFEVGHGPFLKAIVADQHAEIMRLKAEAESLRADSTLLRLILEDMVHANDDGVWLRLPRQSDLPRYETREQAMAAVKRRYLG